MGRSSIVLRNGELVEEGVVPIDPAGQALCLGHSLFETLLVRPCGKDGLFQLEAHLDRLTGSARRLGWERCPEASTLASWARRAARAFRGTRTGYGRLRLTAAWTSPDAVPDVLVRVVPYRVPEFPANVATTEVRVPWTPVDGVPAPKSGSRVTYSFAEGIALSKGCDEALLVDWNGDAVEGAKSNLFAVANERLVTPPVSSGILPGIARATILAVAEDAGIDVEMRPIKPEELTGERALFLTNALWGVRPVSAVDGLPVSGEDGVVRLLADRYRQNEERHTT